MQTCQPDFLASANNCARFIYNDPIQKESYESHIHLGRNPREHIYFDAARVLNRDDELDVDIDYYQELINS
jgi:hypothetical protein